MIRKAPLFILLIAFAVSVSYMGIASAKSQSATLTGAIEKVSLKDKKITIKDDGGSDSKTFDLTRETQYLHNGKSVSEINLKEGDKVKLEVNSTKNTVLRVDVQS